MAGQLITHHNLSYMSSLCQGMRAAIKEAKYPSFVRGFLKKRFPKGAHTAPSWAVDALAQVSALRLGIFPRRNEGLIPTAGASQVGISVDEDGGEGGGEGAGAERATDSGRSPWLAGPWWRGAAVGVS